MSDMDEGDVPLRGWYCKCGQATLSWTAAAACPTCGAAWPESLAQRYPHDGGPPIIAAKRVADPVDHPAHYGGADNPYEAIKVIEAWALDFCLGNAVKYIARAGKKDPGKTVEDLKKARWYLDRAIQKLEG